MGPEQAGASSLRSGGEEFQGRGSALLPTSAPSIFCSLGGGAHPEGVRQETPQPALIPRDPNQLQPAAGPSETCRESLMPKHSLSTLRWTSKPSNASGKVPFIGSPTWEEPAES